VLSLEAFNDKIINLMNNGYYAARNSLTINITLVTLRAKTGQNEKSELLSFLQSNIDFARLARYLERSGISLMIDLRVALEHK